jgi:hypothetical protein
VVVKVVVVADRGCVDVDAGTRGRVLKLVESYLVFLSQSVKLGVFSVVK